MIIWYSEYQERPSLRNEAAVLIPPVDEVEEEKTRLRFPVFDLQLLLPVPSTELAAHASSFSAPLISRLSISSTDLRRSLDRGDVEFASIPHRELQSVPLEVFLL